MANPVFIHNTNRLSLGISSRFTLSRVFVDIDYIIHSVYIYCDQETGWRLLTPYCVLVAALSTTSMKYFIVVAQQ